MATASKGGTTTFETPSDREIVIKRVFNAPRQLVFEAHTRCEHLRNWMLGPEGWTMPECELELRPGSAYRLVWRRADGTQMEIGGVVKEVSPPERFVATESWGAEWPETLNTLVLTEEGGKTTLQQSMLYPSKQARDAALETGMKDGASKSYDRLDEYIAELS